MFDVHVVFAVISCWFYLNFCAALNSFLQCEQGKGETNKRKIRIYSYVVYVCVTILKKNYQGIDVGENRMLELE